MAPSLPENTSVCPLCGRPLGRMVQSHHLIPKRYKGRETVDLHPMCHRKIHSVFTDKELAGHYHTIERLQAHPDLKAYLEWVADKPADFYKPTRRKRSR